MSFWSQIAEVIGTSAVISAIVNYALEELKYKKERTAARLEEHLKYSVENYPNFAMMLNRVKDTFTECDSLYYKTKNASTASESDVENFNNGIYDLLYFLGSLFGFEQEFLSKQG